MSGTFLVLWPCSIEIEYSYSIYSLSGTFLVICAITGQGGALLHILKRIPKSSFWYEIPYSLHNQLFLARIFLGLLFLYYFIKYSLRLWYLELGQMIWLPYHLRLLDQQSRILWLSSSLFNRTLVYAFAMLHHAVSVSHTPWVFTISLNPWAIFRGCCWTHPTSLLLACKSGCLSHTQLFHHNVIINLVRSP